MLENRGFIKHYVYIADCINKTTILCFKLNLGISKRTSYFIIEKFQKNIQDFIFMSFGFFSPLKATIRLIQLNLR